MPHPMNAIIIDAFEFSRQKESREGQIAIADLARLEKESPGASGMLHWSLVGSSGKFGHPQLTVSVSATVQPVCQRCLKPFPLEITSEAVLILAKDEDDADKIEAMLDDDAYEVIVGSKEMNMLDLIEDEALLALPLSPRHEVCPDASELEAPKSNKPSPFAVLKGMKPS